MGIATNGLPVIDGTGVDVLKGCMWMPLRLAVSLPVPLRRIGNYGGSARHRNHVVRVLVRLVRRSTRYGGQPNELGV